MLQDSSKGNPDVSVETVDSATSPPRKFNLDSADDDRNLIVDSTDPKIVKTPLNHSFLHKFAQNQADFSSPQSADLMSHNSSGNSSRIISRPTPLSISPTSKPNPNFSVASDPATTNYSKSLTLKNVGHSTERELVSIEHPIILVNRSTSPFDEETVHRIINMEGTKSNPKLSHFSNQAGKTEVFIYQFLYFYHNV